MINSRWSHIFAIAFLLHLFIAGGDASRKCVSVTGHVRCPLGAIISHGAEVNLYDRDTVGVDLLDDINPDDHMDRAIVSPDGTFHLYGCAYDTDWFFVPNDPEPYIVITHYCSLSNIFGTDQKKKELKIPLSHFVDMGEIRI